MISNLLNHPENEGALTDYHYKNSVNVPEIIKTVNNNYTFDIDKKQYHLQEFIEGEIISLNAAPAWYMEKSAQILVKIQQTLAGYNRLPTLFGKSFLSKSNAINTKKFLSLELQKAEDAGCYSLVGALNERLKHIEKVSSFEFDIDKMTYVNSHGDFYAHQTIMQNHEITTIDWTDACFFPACFEVIMSYTYADPTSKNGSINAERSKVYISEYLKYSSLTNYDLRIMPYFYYYQLCLCNFMQLYDELSSDYLEIAKLCDRLMNWLYINA